MSDEKKSVSLDMLKTRLKSAEADLVTAMRMRARASHHYRSAVSINANTLAMTIVAGLERLNQQAQSTDISELLLRWATEFQVDAVDAGLQRVLVGGAEPLRIWDHARHIFGHQIPMSFESDQREIVTHCAEETGTVGVLGWMTQAGSGQWWPVLNESRFHDLRIVGAWPGFLNEAPYAAIIARGPVNESAGSRTLLIAHDDHHRLQKIFTEQELRVKELARARSLVLFETAVTLSEDDGRLQDARKAGLDGLRVVGSLPGTFAAASNSSQSSVG